MPDDYGSPEVMKFKDGKPAAFTLQFDDSIHTQTDAAIPIMHERGLVGTFFINPERDEYASRREVWEVACPERGHELANHTLRHMGAADLEEADHEIGESSRHIWRLYPHRSKLLPFLRGGGTTWGPSREQIREIMDRYYLFRSPRSAGPTDERGTGADPTPFAQEAIDEGKWVQVGFHGIGGQWLSTCTEGFTMLCDFMVEHDAEIWTGTTGDIYKYEQERDAVRSVTLADATDAGFTLSVECDESKVETYGLPLAELYDEPLTIRVPVPDTWATFRLEQGERTETRETITVDGTRHAHCNVLPNVTAAAVARADG